MKRKLSLLALAVLTVGLLGSCSKMNERIDDLDQRVGNIENEKIASIENQIAAINSSIADLGTIRKDITDLQVAVGAKGEDISELKAADEALGQRIDELKAYVGDLSKYAEKDWVTATFATLEKLNETNTALSALEEKINKLGETTDAKIAGLKTELTNAIDSAISGINATISTLEGRISALEQMIQTVSIIPAYSNGSLKAVDGILTINCVITPKEALETLTKENFTILTSASEVLTKSALYGKIAIAKDEDLVIDKTNGTATIKVDVSSALPADEGKALTVALNVKNGISDFTTEFVPVYAKEDMVVVDPVVNPEEFSKYKAAAPNVDDENVSKILSLCFPSLPKQADDNTDLLILGDYSEGYDNQISNVLGHGGFCLFTEELSKETIGKFLGACGLSAGYADNLQDLEKLEMFGADRLGNIYLAYHESYDASTDDAVSMEITKGPNDAPEQKDGEPEYKKEEPDPDPHSIYAALVGACRWIDQSRLNNKEYAEYNPPYEVDEEYMDSATKSGTKAEGEKSNEIEKMTAGNTYTIKVSATYYNIETPKHKDRHNVRIPRATFSAIATYNIRQTFVFPSDRSGANAGDYYVVNSHLEWVNSGTYLGVRKSSATDLRYCGLLPWYCSMETKPVLKEGYSIDVPANASVLPETVNRQTTHTETRSFNLDFNASIGANGSSCKGMNGNAGLTAGWGWNHTKDYPKCDWTIVKEGTAPSAAHKLQMDEDCLPTPTDSDPGFENVRDLYSSTFDVHESWIWHIPNTNTDSEDAPLTISFSATPHFTWMDHFKTRDTDITARYNFSTCTKSVPVFATKRVGAGIITMENNIENNNVKMTISNVTFKDADSGEVLYEDKNNTYKFGKKMTYGMLSKYKYKIWFKAGKTASTAKWYVVNDPKTIGINETVVIDDLDYESDEVR